MRKDILDALELILTGIAQDTMKGSCRDAAYNLHNAARYGAEDALKARDDGVLERLTSLSIYSSERRPSIAAEAALTLLKLLKEPPPKTDTNAELINVQQDLVNVLIEIRDRLDK